MDWNPNATATDGYVCPPCPVFYPTIEEFQHPLKYISSIRHIGMQAGICKIVPPSGWQPPFAINEKTFRFRTRVQQLNCIDGHTRAEGNFVEALRMFLYRNGTPMQELPRVDGGQLLNLYALYKTVEELGGYERVCDGKLWPQVVRRVGRSLGSDRPAPPLCQQYQKHYETCLLAYERRNDPMLQTPDVSKKSNAKHTGSATSQGSTTTPSGKTRSSVKKQGRVDDKVQEIEEEGDSLSPNSKRVKRTLFAADAGNTSNEDSDSLMDGGESSPAKAVTLKRLNEKSKRIVIDFDDDDDEEEDDEMGGGSPKKRKTGSTKTVAELEPRALKPDPKRKHRLPPPDVHVGQKFYQFIPDEGAKLGEVLRVVRGKKPHVFIKYVEDNRRETVDLSTMQLIVANGWDPEAAELAFKSELCQTCLRGDCWDQLLLCDCCNGGHHLFCLDEPLKEVPSGDWYCDECVTESLAPTKKDSNPKFGFEMGSEYTLAAYKEKADNWKRSYFGMDDDADVEAISDRDLEREYWHILRTPIHEQRLEVEYGSDIDSGTAGSGFPRADDYLKSLKVLARRMRILSAHKGATATQKKLCELFSRGLERAMGSRDMEKLLKKYALDDWNLNNLPKMSGSVLQHLDEDIKGVMIPWIYIGMCFSTFCWHVEDHNFYSISYLHRGAPKTWYGVPCGKAEYFESVMKKLTPELFGSQPDLHLQLVTMFSPETLIKHGVPVYRATHRPNEFIVTFPSAYHGGFNNGFNCAEAVNFATIDWLPWGAKSVLNYRNFSKLPVFAHEALVVSLAETLLENHSFDFESIKHFLIPAVEQLVNNRLEFEGTLGTNNVQRRELMADYARRHGLIDGDTNVAVSQNHVPHSRSCKMTAKTLNESTDNGHEDESPKMQIAKLGVRAAGKMSMSTTSGARPTRMVLWAGNSGKSEGLRCSMCKQYCYLQAVVCTRCRHHSSVGCADHYSSMCKCDSESHYLYLYRYDQDHLPAVLEGIRRRVQSVEDWLIDWNATFSGSNQVPLSLAKKILATGLQAGGAPQENIDDLELWISRSIKWNETAETLVKQSTPEAFSQLARLMGELDRLRVSPDGVEQVESFLGEWSSCKVNAHKLLDSIASIQHTEALSSAFDFDSEPVDTEGLWAANEAHLELVRQLVDVSERAQTLGQPLPEDLENQLHTAKQYMRVLIAANEMLAVISRFTKAKTAAQSSGGCKQNPPPPKPADVAVIMESDCRHVILQADYLENNMHLSIFKIKILRSLLRVTEAEAEELHAALDDYSKSFEELDSLWRRLRSLPICPDQLDELGKRLSLCKSWEHRARKLVDAVAKTASATATRQDVSWDEVLSRPTLDEAERFYEEADRHFVPVSSFVKRQLHARLQDCRRWYGSVQALFVRAPITPESPSLARFLRAAYEKAVAPTRSDIVPTSLQLHCICEQVLNERSTMINCVHCNRIFHMQCVGYTPTAGSAFLCLGCQSYTGQRLRSLQYPPPPYPVFCSCRGPEDMSMICCDICDEWYHSNCIGMTVEEMNQVEAYRCPRCAIRQNLYYLDKKGLRRGAFGRRPAVSRVEALVTQLQTALVALPSGTHELLQYLRHVKDVETRVRMYVTEFASEFSVASFTSLDYRAEQQKLLLLMREVTSLEVHLEASIGNLSAIHWSLRACELVLGCDRAPKYSHLVVLLDDARQPNFVFPRPEYRHIQQTIEDRVARASAWVKQAKTLEAEEWNAEKARRLIYEYHELAQFLELPAAEVEVVFRVAGERLPLPLPFTAHHQPMPPPQQHYSSLGGDNREQRVV